MPPRLSLQSTSAELSKELLLWEGAQSRDQGGADEGGDRGAASAVVRAPPLEEEADFLERLKAALSSGGLLDESASGARVVCAEQCGAIRGVRRTSIRHQPRLRQLAKSQIDRSSEWCLTGGTTTHIMLERSM